VGAVTNTAQILREQLAHQVQIVPTAPMSPKINSGPGTADRLVRGIAAAIL
jgi:hypothetical protein